ncbi:MAG: universal stress protein [Proteobacteria bacterium]|nr:universal stress protein [Pseudomonadota bacterium]
MRTYLVIMDETDEARVALRFATRRAANTKGAVHLLALVPRQPFLAFGGLQATMEAESVERAHALLADAAGSVAASGTDPVVAVAQGDGVTVVRDYLAQHPEVTALVLAAAREGGPGPLVSHFTGAGLGQLPCPLFIVPGGLSEADIDRLS